MSNVIHIDFLRAKRKKRLTIREGRATVEGRQGRVAKVAASMERIRKVLEELKDEGSTRPNRK